MIWGFLKVKLAPFLGSLLSSNVGTKRKEGPDPGSIMLGNVNDNKDDGASDAATSDRRLSFSSREEVAFGGSRFVREPVTRFNVVSDRRLSMEMGEIGAFSTNGSVVSDACPGKERGCLLFHSGSHGKAK